MPPASPTVNPTDDVIPSHHGFRHHRPVRAAGHALGDPVRRSKPERASGTGSDVILPILLALAIVAGVGAYVLRRSRRA